MELIITGKNIDGEASISEGIVQDKIGDMMTLDLGIDGIFNKEDYFLEASDNTLLGEDGEIIYRKNGKPAPDSILHGVTISYDENLREIQITGLNLGEKQWIRFQYDLSIKTEDTNYRGNLYYQTNGTTTLEPIVGGNDRYHFPIPSVKGNYISLEKVWDSADNSQIESVTVDIYRQGNFVDPFLKDVVISRGNQQNTWTKVLYELAPYMENGESFNYTAIEKSMVKIVNNNAVITTPEAEGFVYNVKYEPKKSVLTMINEEYSGDFAALNIYKADRFNPEKLLVGAEFTLFQQDAVGNLIEMIGSSKVTGVGGVATFYIPNNGTFYLKETVPPDGYQTPTIPIGPIITSNKKFESIEATDPEKLGIWLGAIDKDHSKGNITVFDDPVIPLYIRRVDGNGNRIND